MEGTGVQGSVGEVEAGILEAEKLKPGPLGRQRRQRGATSSRGLEGLVGYHSRETKHSFVIHIQILVRKMASGVTGKPPTGSAKGAERCRRGRGTLSPTGLPGLKGSPRGTKSLPCSSKQGPQPQCLPAQAPSSQHRTAHEGRFPWRAAPVTHTSLWSGSSCWALTDTQASPPRQGRSHGGEEKEESKSEKREKNLKLALISCYNKYIYFDNDNVSC